MKIDNVLIIKNLGALAFILMSLQSFYLPSYGFSPFAIAGSFLFFFNFIYLLISKKSLQVSFDASLIFFLYCALFTASFLSQILSSDQLEIKRFLAFVWLSLIAFAAGQIFYYLDLKFIAKTYLVFHISAFLIQFISHYFFGFTFSYLGLLGFDYKLSTGGGFSHSILDNFSRFSGLFNEPGTYATFIAPVLMLYSKNYNCSYTDKLIISIGMLTLLLSFSTYALVFALFIAFSIVVYHKKYLNWQVLLVAFIGGSLVFPYIYYRYVDRASLGSDVGFDFRLNYLLDVYEYITNGAREFLLGAGLLTSDLSGKIQVDAAVNDGSLIAALILTSGVPLAALIFIVMAKLSYRIGYFSFASFLILMVSKTSILWIFTPVVLALLLSKYWNKHQNVDSAFNRRFE